MASRSPEQWSPTVTSRRSADAGLGRLVAGLVVAQRLVGSEAVDGVPGVGEAVGVDAFAHGRGVVVGEPVDADVGGLVGLRQVDARQVGVQPAVDGHGAVVVADEVLPLAPGVGRRAGHPDDAEDGDPGEDASYEQEAARWPRGVAHLLRVDGVGLDREREGVGDVGTDRLELAGVAGSMAAEELRHAGHVQSPLEVGGGADQHRLLLARDRLVGLVDDVDHQAGDVVGGAGLEAGADQLDGGVVGSAHRQDVGEAAVVEHPARAVAAQQQAVAELELHVEQVGVDVVDAVDGLEDQVAVGMGARVLVGDAALVDQALDEGVVLGELADRVAAEEVGPAVADVPEGQLVAVEQRHRGGGAGAAQGRVVVDQLGDAVVGAVQRAGHLARACRRWARLSSLRSCPMAVAEARSPRAAPPTPSQTAIIHGPT